MTTISNCPYPDCNITIEIEEINCAIFRCGIYKESGKQIDPHLSKEQCDQLKIKNKIWGCGKPFQLINGTLIKCEYI
jgi:hypothetical protein